MITRSVFAKIFLLLFLLTDRVPSQWIQRVSPTQDFVTEVAFVNASTGWIATGTDSRLDSTFIWKTTDAALTWTLQNGSKGSCHAIAILDSLNVVYSASGGEGIWRTTDSGTIWNLVSDSAFHCFDIEFVSPTTGYAVGGDMSGIVKKTTDAGQTWMTTAIVQSNSAFSGVSFISPLIGYVVSFFPGQIYQTTDGGFNWIFRDSVGNGDPSYPPSLPVRDVHFITELLGWAAGGLSGFSFIARSTSAGQDWEHQRFLNCGTTFQALQMLDSNQGWVGGYGNNASFPVLRTTNSGNSWELQPTDPFAFRGYKSIFMLDTLNGFAVGRASIYRTQTGGSILGTEDILAPQTSFLLEQNYPNPFNPSTTIDFHVPTSGFVTLKVFDVLGREVATLVNERLTPGSHSRAFNRSGIAGGVYIYRLSTSTYSVTRKMMLLR